MYMDNYSKYEFTMSDDFHTNWILVDTIKNSQNLYNILDKNITKINNNIYINNNQNSIRFINTNMKLFVEWCQNNNIGLLIGSEKFLNKELRDSLSNKNHIYNKIIPNNLLNEKGKDDKLVKFLNEIFKLHLETKYINKKTFINFNHDDVSKLIIQSILLNNQLLNYQYFNVIDTCNHIKKKNSNIDLILDKDINKKYLQNYLMYITKGIYGF